MGQLDEIPMASGYGIVGSRGWADPSAVYRIVTALTERGRPIAAGGCDAIQAATVAACAAARARGLLHTFLATKETGGTLGRDERLLSYLEGGDSVLIAFLALDAKGLPGRTHVLADEAGQRGVRVVTIPAGPEMEPQVAATVVGQIDRALGHLERADAAFMSRDFTRFALYRVAVAAARHLLLDVPGIESRLDRQWAWLDAHPLAVDFPVREHRTLGLLATYTALQRVREALETLVARYGDVSIWSSSFPQPGADEREVRDAWAS